MDIGMRDRFIRLWHQYFEGSDLPITFGIEPAGEGVPRAPVPKRWRCLVCDLARVRKGHPVVIDGESLSCSGAKFYLGYTTGRAPFFRYFLSTGKPGVVEGERYKRTPEIVDEMDRFLDHIPSEGKCYTFKRWDQLTVEDAPEVVVFFARPEVLSGLFTLASFDQADPEGGVCCPFGSGCSSIIYYPWLEQQKEHPRAVLGMFDPSARPCVMGDVLTMAIPMKKFALMFGYMEESFLVTRTWEKVKEKIRRSEKIHGP
ncbi:MAG: DUF169 domain-containing protein [Methanoregulaceae archaeon]|jgi:hypothetical protein|nr:DUF169 domain-containing protein [Methanoregulaceae archaeon]